MLNKLRGCKTCGGIRRGVKGITKAILGIDRSNDTSIDRRKIICKACSYSSKNSTGSFTRLSQCKLCTCLIAIKIRVKSEKCPDKKW